MAKKTMVVSVASLLSWLVCLSTLEATASVWKAEGFHASQQQLQWHRSPLLQRAPVEGAAFVRGGAERSATVEEAAETETETLPTWEDLQSALEDLRSGAPEEKPVLTLYRDTNGWCPFCERVWVAVRAKGLPYQETLVPLQGKPEWYKQMVPTGLVPAVLFHGETEDKTDEGGSEPTSRRELVWESDAILQALDDKFPDTVRLTRKGDEDYEKALDLQNRVQAEGFRFAYGNRNGTATEAELEEIRSGFEAVLDELDEALGAQTGGNFRLGADFSGIDAIMVPTLERWRYQLPLTEAFDILEGRPHLREWFEAMDAFPAYSGRVAGDEYSWTATASMFLRYFGGGEDKPKVAEGIARADAAAEDLSGGFADGLGSIATPREAALEAAAKLVSNHDAVLRDCLGAVEPKSQGHIPRADEEKGPTVDALLRHVASLLLDAARGGERATPLAPPSIRGGRSTGEKTQGALALRTVAKRLCVPRDMGAPSAALLRGILATVADDLSPVE